MTELSPAQLEKEYRKLKIWQKQIKNKTFICAECRKVCCECTEEEMKRIEQ